MRRLLLTSTLFALAIPACGGSGNNTSNGPDLAGDTSDGGGGSGDGGSGDGGGAGDGAASLAGKQVHHLTIDGLQREFIVYLPEKARLSTTPAPVVFMIHGTSQDGEKFYLDSHWRQKADAEGLIAVFPTALVHCFLEDDNASGTFESPAERSVTTKWAHGALGDPARLPLCTPDQLAAVTSATLRAQADHPLADDLAFFRAMVTFLQGSYNVDSKRIYSTGFSNGGQMSMRLTLEMSDLIAASATAAGPFSIPEPPPTSLGRPMSVVYSFGELDDRYTTRCGNVPLPLVETLPTQCAMVGDSITRLLTMLQLTSAYTYDERMISGKKIVRWTYKTSTKGATNGLQVIAMEGLFHQYPDGSNYPVAGADYLWPFFATFTTP